MRTAGFGYRGLVKPDMPSGSANRGERGRRFEPEPMNVRAARDFVSEALKEQGFAGDADVVLLLASELVTNAVRHAATRFEIRVDAAPDQVRVMVLDEDVEHPPEVQHPGPEDTNGRGLLLVEQLAKAWGSSRVGRSKSVWFAFP
jgi:anti-sigma regulatory factor (Ser/Thr protein kinase)